MATFETTYHPGIERIARHLEALPPQPLRRAVVLTPSERHAHAIRRHVVVDRKRPGDLAGVLFIRPLELARQLLVRSDRIVLPGWEAIRRLRILTLLESGELDSSLAYFDPTQLRSGQGYATAFARTIEELEASAIGPEICASVAADLQRDEDDRSNSERLHDVGVVWAAVDRHRGPRLAAPQLLSTAADLLGDRPQLLQPYGPVFALLTRSPSSVLARFLCALDDCRVVFHEARPLRTGTQRWRAALNLPEAEIADTGTDELALVHRYLFEVPEQLTDPQRPRSSGPDASVDLEEYSTIEDEIEAAAIWVNEQVEKGTPLEGIALVTPEVQSYALSLRDRLARSGGAQPPIAVHIAGGVSLADTPAGRRFQILLDALLHALAAESTIRLIPALRRGPTEAADSLPRLSPSRAAEIVYGAGITGGSPGDTSGVGEWTERLARRRDALRRLAAADGEDENGDEPEKRQQLISRHHANRWLRDVEPVLPAIEALQKVAESVVAGVALPAMWSAVHELAKNWLRFPPDPPNLPALLEQRLQPILADPVASTITGTAAIRFLMDRLRSETLMLNRFGEPAVFIGSTAQAAGLSFAAVRLVGLAEGALPHTPHDDPIVPDVLRLSIETVARKTNAGVIVPRLSDHVLDEIHDAFRVIGGARECLALSAPRQWTDRSDREVSGVLLEVATALGREATGAGDVPTSGRLRSAYFGRGREARAAASASSPLTPRALQSSVTAVDPGEIRVPAAWLSRLSIGVDRVQRLAGALAVDELGAMDGAIVQTWKGLVPPGFGDKPVSASALGVLLSCPHRFMLERLIRLAPPAARPSTDVVDPIAYGSLFHAAVERFLGEAGPALCRREGNLAEWIARARSIAAEELDELCHVYPLRGADATERERMRLLRQIERLVEYEWHKPPREFVATELGFGEPVPVSLGADETALKVRGAIDRVDRVGAGALAVRDIKTGRMYDLIDEPVNAARDLQIGVYTLALEAVGDGEQVTEACYVHPSAAHEQERGFAGGELDRLREHTRAWLWTAHAILESGMFVRTPNVDDCRFCPFVPSCGEGAQQLSQAKLEALPQAHPLARFVELKKENRGEEQ